VAFATAGPGAGDEATPSTTSVTVNLNTADDDVVTTVDLTVITTASDAATLTDDYTLSTTTISFPADGSTIAQSFDITVVDDAIFEGTESVTLRLSNPVNADLGGVTEYTLNITDNDSQPVAAFTDVSSFTNESLGSASIEVALDAVSVTDVTIDYTVTSTATSGADFTLTDGSVLIPAGSASEDIQVVIVNDLVVEAAETVTITLTGGTNATLGGNTVHVLTILDNDQTGGTGPGGVGGSDNNLVWLRGDNFVAGTWTDISGNSNDFTGAGPIAGATGINGQPTVEFDGSQSMTIASAISSTVSDYDIFVVTDADVATDQATFNGTGGLLLGLENSNGAFQDQAATWKGDEIATGTGAPSIVRYNLESGSGLSAVSLNGTEDVPTVSFDYVATAINSPSTLGSLSGGGSGFDGEMAEFIIYNTPLNDAQSVITTNYLATRYGITIANDFFAYDDGTANGDYYYDLIGIGQADASNIHVSATSENFLSISNPDGLGDGEYLMLANDNEDMTTWTLTGAPANGSTQRLAKQWRVDKTGDVGSITLQIDTTALPAPPADGLTWALIVTSDGDFTSIDNTYPLTSVSGDIVGINGLTLNDGDYFTFAVVQYQSTGVSSDFSNPAAWTTGVVPGTGTNVTIADGHSLFLTEDIVIGSLVLEGTGSLDLAGFTLEFSNDCISLNGTGTVNVNTVGSTIGYANPNVTEQCVTSMVYNNLFTDGPIGSTKYLLGDITIQGDLDLQGGGSGAVFDSRALGTSDDYDIVIQGNWTSDITFNPRSGTVTFNGTSNQTINTAGGETFNNLVINKDGTTNKADSTLSLGSNVFTEGALNMTLGFVDLGAFDFEIKAGSSITGGSADAYLVAESVGVLRHAIETLSTAYTFPIGDSDNYAPFTFTLNAGTLSDSKVTINLRDAKHTNISESEYITRYWTLKNEDITGSIDYDVSYTYDDVDIVGIESQLLARKFSVSGDDLGGAVNTGTNTLSNTGYNSFSDFTGESEPIPLPVELLYFEGASMDNVVRLTWATASEVNNDYFEIQRSEDGESFESIGEVAGFGNSSEIVEYVFSDVRPLFGQNYYRLRQVDVDGQYEILPTIMVDHNYQGKEMTSSFYPNPAIVGRDIMLEVESGNMVQKVYVEIVNLQGQSVFSREIEPALFILERIALPERVEAGLYIMTVQQGEMVQRKKLLVR
jgi:hypothetical protein